jgi:hypothetical protein
MPKSMRLLAAAASLMLSGTVMGQDSSASPVRPDPKPLVVVTGVSAVTSLANWPGLSLSVNKNAYVTVVAVTRTTGSALPLQILSPAAPSDVGTLKAGKTVRPRVLLGDEAMHLLNYGGSPLIVAFASQTKPELSAFTAGGRWGHDLLMDTLVTTEQQMVEILAKTIFATGVAFDAVISAPSTLTAVPTVTGAFAFRNGPVTFARFATSITGRIEASLDPIIMTADVYQKSGMLPQGYISGAPFPLTGGSIAAIEKGRVVYLPQVNAPPTAAQRAAPAGAGSTTTPPPSR